MFYSTNSTPRNQIWLIKGRRKNFPFFLLLLLASKCHATNARKHANNGEGEKSQFWLNCEWLFLFSFCSSLCLALVHIILRKNLKRQGRSALDINPCWQNDDFVTFMGWVNVKRFSFYIVVGYRISQNADAALKHHLNLLRREIWGLFCYILYFSSIGCY